MTTTTHPGIDRHEDRDRQHHEGQERPHGLQHVDDEVSDRLAGLHDLGRDAAGKVVLVEIIGLLDDPPERLPAHHRVEAGHDDLLLDDGRADHDRRPDDEQQRQQTGEFGPVVDKQRLRVRRIQKVDQPADRPVECGVHRSCQATHDEQEQECTLRLLCEIDDELPARRRQNLAVGVVKRIDGALEAPPQVFTKSFVAHSAAMSSTAGSSCSRNPPDCLCQSWA